MSKRVQEFLTKHRVRKYGVHAENIIADLEDNLKSKGWNIPCKAYDFLKSALIIKLFYGLPEVFQNKIVEHLNKKSVDLPEK